MLGSKRLRNPNHLLRAHTGGIGDDLAQVRVVGFIKLVLDDDLLVAIRAENVQLEVAHPVLGGDQHQFAHTERVSQRVKIVSLSEPRSKLSGFVFPSVA